MNHTMKADELANLERINEEKSKSDVSNPLEPLIVILLKGFIDDADLSKKLQALYKVTRLLSSTGKGHIRLGAGEAQTATGAIVCRPPAATAASQPPSP